MVAKIEKLPKKGYTRGAGLLWGLGLLGAQRGLEGLRGALGV